MLQPRTHVVYISPSGETLHGVADKIDGDLCLLLTPHGNLLVDVASLTEAPVRGKEAIQEDLAKCEAHLQELADASTPMAADLGDVTPYAYKKGKREEAIGVHRMVAHLKGELRRLPQPTA